MQVVRAVISPFLLLQTKYLKLWMKPKVGAIFDITLHSDGNSYTPLCCLRIFGHRISALRCAAYSPTMVEQAVEA